MPGSLLNMLVTFSTVHGVDQQGPAPVDLSKEGCSRTKQGSSGSSWVCESQTQPGGLGHLGRIISIISRGWEWGWVE